ncbi:MAG: hypothetical protein GXO21_05595 [Aquificae bacterium]|nr:hypothetical protein [Aquificota bacterium]
MKKLISFLKDFSSEKGFDFFIYEDKKEVWITGNNHGIKFDLLVRPIKNRYIKIIYETPSERIPVLFDNEEKAIKRIEKFFIKKEKAEIPEAYSIIEEKLNVEM